MAHFPRFCWLLSWLLALAGGPAGAQAGLVLVWEETIPPSDARACLAAQWPAADSAQWELPAASRAEADSLRQCAVASLQACGYLDARAAPLPEQPPWRASLRAGPRWQWGQVGYDSSARPTAKALRWGKRPPLPPQAPARPAQARQALEEAVAHAENRGYPFAQAYWDYQPDTAAKVLAATLYLRRGPLVRFDTLKVQGDANIEAHFLALQLGLTAGTIYSTAALRRAERLLAQLPYLRATAPMRVAFQFNRAAPLLALQAVPASQISGLVGLLFDPARQQRPILTGDVSLALLNPFGKGRDIQLAFKRLRPSSQQLNAQYLQPSLLRSRFGLGGQFSYWKEDSTFFNIERTLQVRYRMGNGDVLQAEAHWLDRRVDARVAAAPAAFEAYGASRWLAYGLGYERKQLGHPWWPRRGHWLQLKGRLGNKRLQPLLAPDHPDYPALYGNRPLRMAEGHWDATYAQFLPLGRQAALLLRLRSAGIASRWRQENELLRLGGMGLMRGFNEWALRAAFYGIGTAEYRIYWAAGGYVSAFADGGALRVQLADRPGQWQQPLGVGVGLTFGTKAGIFQIAYALGQLWGTPIDLRTAKVHFGLTSVF